MSLKRIVILFSGEGTNLENLIKKLHEREFDGFRVEVAKAITNNPDANGIKRAKKCGVEVSVIDHRDFKTREEFDKRLVAEIEKSNPHLTVLAGFMRILTPVFTDRVKAINLHPSILPLFKGANAIKESFSSDMKVAGVSVHFVTSELDSGKIIDQECFKKSEGMSFEDFERRIHQIEYEIFPKAVLKVLKEA